MSSENQAFPIELHDVKVDERRVRISETGAGPAVVLIHGGRPDTGGYAASGDIWAPLTTLLAPHHRVFMVDRPGFGNSSLTGASDLSYSGNGTLIVEALARLGLRDFHIVGHGEGGLLALQLARRADVYVRSCTVLAGNEAAPTGDSPLDVRLMNPPGPYASERAQAWLTERISYTPHHIDGAFLASLTTHAGSDNGTYARSLVDDADIRTDLWNTKDALFAYARDVGYAVPIALIWGSHDPLSSIDRGVELMKFLATTSAELSFHVVNRSGHFVFREHPQDTARLLLSFVARARELTQ